MLLNIYQGSYNKTDLITRSKIMLKNLTMQYQRIYFRGKLTNIQELFKQKLSSMYFKQKAI